MSESSVPTPAKPKPKTITARDQLMNQIRADMGPVAARIFREARNEGYKTGDWIAYAGQQVADDMTERIFGILHSIAVANEKKEVSKNGRKN